MCPALSKLRFELNGMDLRQKPEVTHRNSGTCGFRLQPEEYLARKCFIRSLRLVLSDDM